MKRLCSAYLVSVVVVIFGGSVEVIIGLDREMLLMQLSIETGRASSGCGGGLSNIEPKANHRDTETLIIPPIRAF